MNQNLKKENEALRKLAKKIIQKWEKSKELNSQAKKDLKKINHGCQKMVNWVYNKVKKVINENKTPGLLGGDHSIALGGVKALSETYKNYGLLQVDAHLDLRPSYQGFTYSHASIMHHVLTLPRPPQKLISVGVRDVSTEEWKRVEKDSRLVAFTDHKLHQWKFCGKTWDKICKNIVSQLPKEVYLSIDVDGLSPENFPHTGTPVPGGLKYNELLHLISEIVKANKKIIGFDLSEIATSSSEDWDGNIGMRLLYKLCSWSVLS